MGNCIKPLAGDLIRPLIAPPTINKSFNSSEVYNIIKQATKCDTIILYDSVYDAIDTADVKRFLISNINNDYVADAYDCDNFTFAIVARVHNWAYKRKNRSGGLCFGILAGDLRLQETDPERPHAVGFFIDSNKKLCVVDGMYNEILELQPWMRVWNVIV